MEQTTPKKHSPQGLVATFVVVAIAAAILFIVTRPKPPQELPDLNRYIGSITVSHGNAIVDAKMGEHSSAKLIDALLQYSFNKSVPALPQEAVADIELTLSPESSILLANFEGSTFAQVTSPTGENTYQLKAELYIKIKEVIYEAFPGGVQTLDIEPWWKKYLSIASYTILPEDFNSPKEIPIQEIIDYTFYQMVADATAKELEVVVDNTTTVNIPYDLMLARARRYFGDGADATLKQARSYDPISNSFIISALPEKYYTEFPYGDYTDYTKNQNYSLRSLTREPDGQVIAIFEDYNRSGFHEQGNLNKVHYLTMSPAADGEYRFLNKRSELANPSNVSVEGYFMGHISLAEFTATEAYDNNLNQGIALGENLLLYSVRYTKESARLSLYLLDPSFGNLISQQVITANAQTYYWDIRTNDDGILLRTNQGVICLNGDLEETHRIALPTNSIPSFDPYGYDISSDLTQLVYTSTEGVYLRNLAQKAGEGEEEVEDILLAPHPLSEEEAQSSSNISNSEEQPTPELLRRPTFVKGGSQVLVSHATTKSVLGYSVITLDETPSIRRLNLPESTGAEELITDDKIILTLYPGQDGTDQSAIYTILYYDENEPQVFGLSYDSFTPKAVVKGDILFCFQPEISLDPTTTDHFYRLWRVNLKNATQEKLSVLVQNASPSILAVSNKNQILFSYRAPSGSGFGITSPLQEAIN